MSRMFFFVFVVCSCLPNKESSLSNLESHPIKVGDEIPVISADRAEQFFNDWDNKWTAENVVSIDEEVDALVKAIKQTGQQVRLIADGTQSAVKKKIQVLTPVLSSILPNKNDYYFVSKLMLPGHFAIAMEFDGKLYEQGVFKTKKACKAMAGIPCMLSLEAKYSIMSELKDGVVNNVHCGSIGCRFAGLWLYEIEIEKTSEGIKFSFPKAVAHTSFAELFEHSIGSPIILEVSKKTAKSPRYIGLDRSNEIIWTSDAGDIDSIKEFNVKTKACPSAN